MPNNEVKVNSSLFLAVCCGEAEKTEELVSCYGLSYSPDFDGGYALLFNAALFGYKKIVKFLLTKGANVNSGTNHADTPLHFAAWFADVELAQLLLDHKAVIDAKDGQDESPLHIACQKGHENVVELLLSRGANPNAVRELPAIHEEKFSHVKIDPAAFAAACRIGHEGFADVLNYGAHIDNSDNGELDSSCENDRSEIAIRNSEDEGNVTPLHLAAEMGHLKAVLLLLNNGASIDAQTTNHSTPLLFAAIYGHTLVAKSLIERGASINMKDDNSLSPLYFAVETKNLRLISYLLQRKPNVDGKIVELILDIIAYDDYTYPKIVDDFIEYGFTPPCEDVHSASLLGAAVRKGYTKMVKCLLNHGAKLDNAAKANPFLLHHAVESGEKEMIRLFLDSGFDINTKDEFGATPICYSMNSDDEDKHAETIQLLVDHGANLKEAPDLLRKAVSEQNIDVCRILIKNGADVNALDKNGKTPLHRAVPIKYGFFDQCKCITGREVTKLLLGAEFTTKTEDCFTQLHLGVPSGREDIVRILLEYGADVNSRTNDDSTALHLACQRGYEEIVDVLLSNGANVEALQMNGSTPLHVAAQKGHAEIVETLLKFNADIDSQGASKETALHHAVIGNHSDVVLALLKNGCNVNVENGRGMTALGLAVSKRSSCSFIHCAGHFKRRAVITDALKKQVIKLKAAGLFVSEKNLCHLGHSSASQIFQQKCEVEVIRMKRENLCLNYRLVDVLEDRRYPRHMRNESLVNTLETFSYEDFPIYKTLLVSSFENSKKTLALLTSGAEWLNVVVKTSNVVNDNKSPIPPTDVLEEIVSYLTKRDLNNLISCGESLKAQLCK